MTDLLIKGMEMPESCYLCRLGDQGLGIKCRIAGETYTNLSNRPSARPSWCPLIEVPTPHGRLIDADAIPFVQSEDGCTDDYAYRYDINELPTVIEAKE